MRPVKVCSRRIYSAFFTELFLECQAFESWFINCFKIFILPLHLACTFLDSCSREWMIAGRIGHFWASLTIWTRIQAKTSITLPPDNHYEAGTHQVQLWVPALEWSPLLFLREKEPGGQGQRGSELPEARPVIKMLSIKNASDKLPMPPPEVIS